MINRKHLGVKPMGISQSNWSWHKETCEKARKNIKSLKTKVP